MGALAIYETMRTIHIMTTHNGSLYGGFSLDAGRFQTVGPKMTDFSLPSAVIPPPFGYPIRSPKIFRIDHEKRRT
ncbi:MAG: hypothetical protein ACOC98_01820, partial [Thermodesulfobacteriota bacterium]